MSNWADVATGGGGGCVGVVVADHALVPDQLVLRLSLELAAAAVAVFAVAAVGLDAASAQEKRGEKG